MADLRCGGLLSKWPLFWAVQSTRCEKRGRRVSGLVTGCGFKFEGGRVSGGLVRPLRLCWRQTKKRPRRAGSASMGQSESIVEKKYNVHFILDALLLWTNWTKSISPETFTLLQFNFFGASIDSLNDSLLAVRLRAPALRWCLESLASVCGKRQNFRKWKWFKRIEHWS